VYALNPNTKERKKLLTYLKTYGITTWKKHVDCDHAIIVKQIEEEVNVVVKGLNVSKTTSLKKKEYFRKCNI